MVHYSLSAAVKEKSLPPKVHSMSLAWSEYSGIPLLWTHWGPGKVSYIVIPGFP